MRHQYHRIRGDSEAVLLIVGNVNVDLSHHASDHIVQLGQVDKTTEIQREGHSVGELTVFE